MRGKLRKWMLHVRGTVLTASGISHPSMERRTSIRLGVGILPILCTFGFMAFTASISGAVEQPVLPYLSKEYRYTIVTFDDLPGFEQPSFDDSGFSIGDAAFGIGGIGECPLLPTVKTTWPLSTDLLLRKTFTLPPGASSVKVAVAIDNDVQVFVNGVDISGGLQMHEFCAERDSFIFPVPDAILNVGTSNVLAVRARDRGPCCDYVDVEVRAELPPNRLPTCTAAQAFPAALWSPKHQLVPIVVMGVTDPDGDGVKITVTGVTQDEPVNANGDGNTSPDAVIEAGAALVRAERSGKGNGRIYEVSFKAEDGKGGFCNGTVTVGVPHSLNKGVLALDDGQLYDSTVP
jgi:hypothetical protein